MLFLLFQLMANNPEFPDGYTQVSAADLRTIKTVLCAEHIDCCLLLSTLLAHNPEFLLFSPLLPYVDTVLLVGRPRYKNLSPYYIYPRAIGERAKNFLGLKIREHFKLLALGNEILNSVKNLWVIIRRSVLLFSVTR